MRKYCRSHESNDELLEINIVLNLGYETFPMKLLIEVNRFASLESIPLLIERYLLFETSLGQVELSLPFVEYHTAQRSLYQRQRLNLF